MEIVDILRGVAAMGVCWFHLTNSYDQGGPVELSGAYGWLGIEVFFVISGFIIPTSIARAYDSFSLRDFPRYMLRRLTRLEPPYIASVILVIVLWELSAMIPTYRGATPHYSVPQIASHMFYAIPATQYNWLQPVYWSLTFEFLFYVVCGLLFGKVINRRQYSVIWFLAIATVAALVMGPLPARALLFIMGIAVFRVKTCGEKLWLAALIILVCGAVMAAVGAMLEGIVGALTCFVISVLAERRFRPTPWLRIGSYLGTVSYSLYLIHVPIGGRVINFGTRFVSGPAQEFALSLAALFASLIAATLFYISIERPAIRAAKRVRLGPMTVKASP